MILIFTLTMPGVGSWNGKWSGEGKLYAITRSVPKPKAEAILGKPSYRYGWPDGWAARVEVRCAKHNEAAAVKRKSAGFCGYEWMVDRIISHGKILSDDQL